jgi:predicted dehydrogenase
MQRRDFIKTGSLASAALTSASLAQAQAEAAAGAPLDIAIVGCGEQGRVLRDAVVQIPNVNIKAVCDIWDFQRNYIANQLKRQGHNPERYEDIHELLEKEKTVKAVLIATPDFMHAPHTIACLEAGRDVYCEKMMSHTIEAARSMVQAARRTGRLLQIGHQRRSNPKYQHVYNKLLHGKMSDGNNVFGGPFQFANAQWNRGKSEPRAWPVKNEIPAETLKKYGYDNMMEFRNWRWFLKYGGGPMSDLGAHQIDILTWFFDALPTAVVCSGGRDFYKDYEHPDNVMAIYEFARAGGGTARGFYQVLTTTSSLGFFERFMGVNATLAISEVPRWRDLYREAYAPEWAELGEAKLLARPEEPAPEASAAVKVDSRETAGPEKWLIPADIPDGKKIHQPHLENFFEAVHKQDPKLLNCPSEVAFRTCVMVLKVNEAIAKGLGRVEFKPEDFAV